MFDRLQGLIFPILFFKYSFSSIFVRI